LLLADDLGYLLRRCPSIVVRDGEEPVALPAPLLLGWRVLEIVLASPYLPPARQLRDLFPAARVREGLVDLPLGLGSAEEALAACAAEGIAVGQSRILYRPTKR
jgi:hypothetical protein